MLFLGVGRCQKFVFSFFREINEFNQLNLFFYFYVGIFKFYVYMDGRERELILKLLGIYGNFVVNGQFLIKSFILITRVKGKCMFCSGLYMVSKVNVLRLVVGEDLLVVFFLIIINGKF